jgi:hypothetical protein
MSEKAKKIRGCNWILLYDKRENRDRCRSQIRGVLLGIRDPAEAGVFDLCLCLWMERGERQKPCLYVLRKAEVVCLVGMDGMGLRTNESL